VALLELEDATKRYGALTVVDGLSLHVEAGEALGVVGPNGAGKRRRCRSSPATSR
jgi:ABC-type multidrug transport system ATPase subunit